MAVAELEQIKNDSTGTSSGNVDGIKSANSYINFDNISGKVSSTGGTYDRYKELEDFSFTMPGGWGSRDIEIFLKSCWTNLDHLRTLSNDENKKWGEIASFITEKSNGHIFTINSCMEVAMCIKEYINEKKDVLMSDNSFRQFYNEVLDLLPYFPEPRYVSQTAQMNANTSWYNAIDENYSLDKNTLLKETLIELIVANYNEIKEGNQSIWGEISTTVSKRTGLNIDVKALVKHVKRTVQLEVPQEKDPLDKKELFFSFMKKIVNGHDFVRYSVFHIKNNLSPVNSPLNISDYEETKLKRRYSVDQLSYRKSKNISEDGKISRDCDLVNVGRRTLQKRRGRKPRNLGARKLETDSYKKVNEDLFAYRELPNTSFVTEQNCPNVLETNNENNLILKKEITLKNIASTNEIKLTKHRTIPQSESSSSVKEVPTGNKKKDNTKKKHSNQNVFFVEGTQNELSVDAAFENERNHSYSSTKSDISKVGVKNLNKKNKQSRARTLTKPHETIHKKETFVGENECKVLVGKCEPFISEVSRKRFHDNVMDDDCLTNSNENDLPVKQIKLSHEKDDMLHKPQFIKSSLSESNLFGLHKEDPRIKVLPRRCRRKLNPPTRILPMRKCAVKENELLFNEKIDGDSGFSELKYQSKVNNGLPVSEVNLYQLPAGKSQLTLSEPITEKSQLEFDHGQSIGDHSYSICIEGRRSKSGETCRATGSLCAEGDKSKTTHVKGKYKKNARNSNKTDLFVIDTTSELVNSEPEQLGSKRDENDSDYLGFLSHDETSIVGRKTRRNKKISHVSYLPFHKDTNKKDYILSSSIDKNVHVSSLPKNVNKSIVTNPRVEIKSEDIFPLDLSQKSLQYSSVMPQKIRSLDCQIQSELNNRLEAPKKMFNSQETIKNRVKENGDCPGFNETEKTYMINIEQKDLVNSPQIKCKTKVMSKTKHNRATDYNTRSEETLTNKVQKKRSKRKPSFSSIQPLSKDQNEIVILTDCNEKVFSKISCGVSKSDNAIAETDNDVVPQNITHDKGNKKPPSTIALGSDPDLPKRITKFDSIKQKNELTNKNNSLLVEIIEGNSDNIKTPCLPKQAERYTKSISVRVGKHNNDKKIRCRSSTTSTGHKSNKPSISSICESNVLIDYALNKIESDSHFSGKEMFEKSAEQEDKCTVEHSSSTLYKSRIQSFKNPNYPPSTVSSNLCDSFESLDKEKIDLTTLKLAKGCEERFRNLKTTGNKLCGSGDPFTEVIRVMEPNLFESTREINKVITWSNFNESNCAYLVSSYDQTTIKPCISTVKLHKSTKPFFRLCNINTFSISGKWNNRIYTTGGSMVEFRKNRLSRGLLNETVSKVTRIPGQKLKWSNVLLAKALPGNYRKDHRIKRKLPLPNNPPLNEESKKSEELSDGIASVKIAVKSALNCETSKLRINDQILSETKSSKFESRQKTSISSEGTDQLVKLKQQLKSYPMVELGNRIKFNKITDLVKLQRNKTSNSFKKHISLADQIKFCVPKLTNKSINSSLLTSNSDLEHSELVIENGSSITPIGHHKNMMKLPILVTDMSQIKTGRILQNNAQVLPFGNQFCKNLLSIPNTKMKMSIVNDVLNIFNNRILTDEQSHTDTIAHLLLSRVESCFPSKKIYSNRHIMEMDHSYGIVNPFSPTEENMRISLSLDDELLADNKTAMILPYKFSSKELTKSRNMYINTLTKIINALSNRTDRIEYYQVDEINNLSASTSKIIQKEHISNPCQVINQVIKIKFNNNTSGKFFIERSGNKGSKLISKLADSTSNKNNELNEFSVSMPILCSGITHNEIKQYKTNPHSLICKISLNNEDTNEVILKFPNILLSRHVFNSTNVIKPFYLNKCRYDDSSQILEYCHLNRLTPDDVLNSIGTVHKVTDIVQTTSFPCKLIRNIALCGKKYKGKTINSQKIFKLNKGLSAHKYLPLRCQSCKRLALNASCREISPSLPTEIQCVTTMTKKNDQISVAKSSCSPNAGEIHFNRDITCTAKHVSLNNSSSCACNANILLKTARVLGPKQTHIDRQYDPSCISNLKVHTSEKLGLHFTNPGTLLNCYADTSHTVRGRKRKLSGTESKFRTDTTNKKQLTNQITSIPITIPLRQISKDSVKTSTGLILNTDQPSPIDTETSIFDQQKTLVYCPKRKLRTPLSASTMEKTTERILSSPVQLNSDGDELFSIARQQPARKAKSNILYNSSSKKVGKKLKQQSENSENIDGHNFQASNSKTIYLKTRDKNSNSESYSTISNKSLIFNRTSSVKFKQQKYNDNILKKSTTFPLIKLNDIMRIEFVSRSIMNNGSVNIVEFEGRVMHCKSSHTTSKPDTFDNSKVIHDSKLSTANSNLDVFVNNKTYDRFNLSSSTKIVDSNKNSLYRSMNEIESLQTNKECLSTGNISDKSFSSEKCISKLVNSPSVVMFNIKPDVLGKLVALQENTSNKITCNSLKETASSTCPNVEASSTVTKQFRKKFHQKYSSSSSNAQKLISRNPRSSLTLKNGQEEIPCNLEQFNNTLQKGVYLNKNQKKVDSSFNIIKSKCTTSQNAFVNSQHSSLTREDNQGETLNYSKNYSKERLMNLRSKSTAFSGSNSSINTSCMTIRTYRNRKPSHQIDPTKCIQSTHEHSASSNRYNSDIDISRIRYVENHNKQINLSFTYLKENISCIREGGTVVSKEHMGSYTNWLSQQKQRLGNLDKMLNKVKMPN